MVLREWSARLMPEREHDYLSTVRALVLPMLATHDGYLGAFFARQPLKNGLVEYRVTSCWESEEDIRAFAGDDCLVAVVPEEIAPTLVDYDRSVRHLEVSIGHELHRIDRSLPSDTSED